VKEYSMEGKDSPRQIDSNKAILARKLSLEIVVVLSRKERHTYKKKLKLKVAQWGVK
jgi:hypothetical protein